MGKGFKQYNSTTANIEYFGFLFDKFASEHEKDKNHFKIERSSCRHLLNLEGIEKIHVHKSTGIQGVVYIDKIDYL